ncbi:MAG: LytR C-terminal domain-containing protein [Dermatophilaceae bacterium]
MEGNGTSIRRRRQRRRAAITMTLVAVLMFGTFAYAAAYFQGWLSTAPNTSQASPACQGQGVADALTPRAMIINVYNATDRDGLAKSVAKSLRSQGFTIGEVTNDPLGRRIVGVGEVRHGRPGNAGAALLAKRLPGAKLVLDKRSDRSVDLVLGSRFTALRAPAGVVPAKATRPTTSPASSC